MGFVKTRWRSAALITVGILLGVVGYLAVAGDALGLHESSGAEIRLLVREHEGGTIEVAAQQLTDDGTWSQRLLPENRFLSGERESGTWYRSSSLGVQDPYRENRFCVISHGQSSDFFWRTTETTALRWAGHHRQQVSYFAEPSPQGQAARIDQCVADGFDAVVTTLAAPDVLAPAISRATAAGVPVVSFNSGANDFTQVGSFMHASVDESEVGERAAEQFAQAGITGDILCVIHEERNVGLVERCDGL